MGKLIDTETIKERMKNLHNGEYELIGEYEKSNKPITVRHKCGYTYIVKSAKHFLQENGSQCPICHKRQKVNREKGTEESFIKRLKEQVGDEYTYLGGYVDSHTKVLLKHNVCGNLCEITPQMFLGNKQRRCRFCANKIRGKYAIKENYLENLLKDKKYGKDYEWLEPYKNNNKLKHKIKHLKCNNIYEVRPNDFQQGYTCPYCSNKYGDSKEEYSMLEFIKENYKNKIIHCYKDGRYEIDIFLPDLNIGFEYNGCYWHSDKFKDKNSHIVKLNYFKEKGITIYFIESVDWINKADIIKSKILHLIKCNNKDKIFARNTEIKFKVPYTEKRDFLNKNHIQGFSIDSFNFGLYYKEKLVALMTFSKGRNNVNSDKLELLRYATDINYIVVGGFSKLLKHSLEYIRENLPEYEYLYTFADLSISRGDIYYKNNFLLDHISEPSYYYVKNNKKINRFTLRKSQLKINFPEYYNDNLTEFEITDKIPNLHRIWNCGNLVFKYKIN